MVKTASPRFNIDLVGLKKVGKGALIAGVGAALVFGTENMSSLDFGEYTPFVAAAAMILINFVRKLLIQYQ